MTQDPKTAAEQKAPTSPPTPPATTPPAAKAEAELTRVKYTGNSAGSVRDDKTGAVLAYHVEPGDVLDPETDKERAALLKTGHFELTRSRATTTATTDETTRRIAQEVKEAEAAAQTEENK